MKKIIIRAAALILTALLVFPVFVSYGADEIAVVDDSEKYKLYTETCGFVYPADGGGRELFSYDVPEGGAALVIFFNGAGWCVNSNNLISGLSSTLWARDERFNIVAVDSYRNDRATVKSYLAKYDLEGRVDRAYCNPENMYLFGWYSEFVSRGGDMEGVTGFSADLEFPHVLIVTREGGRKVIRYSIPGVTPTLLTSIMGSLFDIPEGENETVTVKLPGVRRYDYADDILSLTNGVRREAGVKDIRLSAKLCEIAMERAEECAVYYSHERPNGYSCFSIVNGTGRYNGIVLSENIAIARETPSLAVDGWTRSEGHRENMISADVTEVGVGCFVNNGHHFWVQLFGDGNDKSTLKNKSAAAVEAQIESLESRLSVRPSGRTVTLSLEGDAEGAELFGYSENLTEYEQHISYLCRLMPKDSFAYDSSGEPVARVDAGGKIYPVKAGVGTLELRLFDMDRRPEIITVKVVGAPHTAGDADGDGVVSMKDVLLLRRIVAGAVEPTEEGIAFADVDGDGNVNMKDVLLLRKILAGAA